MTEQRTTKNIGLRGVKVADTRISDVNGGEGLLIYRGYRIEALAEHSTFEETAYLLLHDALPTRVQLAEFMRDLAEARELPSFVFDSIRRMPKTSSPMDVLQASVPLLATADRDLSDDSREANRRKAIRLIARIPMIVAGWHRIRTGHDPLPADERLSHAANFLWQLRGAVPDDELGMALDVALILHADHSFNASTFACRAVVSTQAHMYAGIAAGVGALSGALHGGANAQVMKMLDAIKDERDITGWVRKRLDSGMKIMGMGHAVYKTMDPRARFLKELCVTIGEKLGQDHWCRLSSQVAEAVISEFAKRGKTTIKPNVDFFSAPVYHLMGIPGDLMTPVFAISRISGWTAHIIEEKFGDAHDDGPALYRPLSDYTGNYCGREACTYIEMEMRK